jgi:hypothetical protein
MSPRNRVAQLYPRALGSHFVASYYSRGYGGGILTHLQSQTDCQSVWCQAPICDPRPIFPLLSLIICRQLRVSSCGASSLTRRRVCSFQFLLGIASADFLTSESHATFMVLCLFFTLPHPGGPGSCIYFPQEQGSPIIPIFSLNFI